MKAKEKQVKFYMSETTLINATEKIRLGCFYTTQNIFSYPHFQE
jgi:hypothetical protein